MHTDENLALIECAAMLMQTELIAEPTDALRRAAKRIGIAPTRWPKAEAVRAALHARLALFDPDSASRLLNMRQAAFEAMTFFSAFAPRLVGGLVEGTAPVGCVIEIECQCEHPDQIRMRLDELKIPAQQRQKLKTGYARTWFEFKAGEFVYSLRAMSEGEVAAAPELSADLAKLKKLLGRTAS